MTRTREAITYFLALTYRLLGHLTDIDPAVEFMRGPASKLPPKTLSREVIHMLL